MEDEEGKKVKVEVVKYWRGEGGKGGGVFFLFISFRN